MELVPYVLNVRVHVSKALDVRAIMGMQDVWADSGVNTCKTYRHVAIVQRQHC
jgi:hypothetical protein